MEAYGVGRLFGALFIAVLAGAVIWAGLQRRKRGENGTVLIAAGAVLATAFLVTILQSSR